MTEVLVPSAEANDQQVAPVTVQPDQMDTHTLTTTSKGVETTTEMIEESEVCAHPAASGDDVLEDASKPDQPRVSRFANLGLNAHLTKNVGRNNPVPGKSTRTRIHLNTAALHPITQRRKVVEDDEMDELEELSIPANHRKAYREEEWLPIDPRPKMPHDFKYSNAVVTNLGWRPMHNQNARIVRGPIETTQDGEIIDGNLTERDLLVEKLKKHAAAAAQRSLQQFNDDERELAELVEEQEKPLVDGKYFVLENYLRHSGQSKEGQVFQRDEPYEPDCPQSSIIAPQVSVATGRVTRSRVDGGKAVAKLEVPAASSSRATTSKESENIADVPSDNNVVVRDVNSEPTLERIEKFELTEDSSDGVVVGQPAPEKLDIRLRRVSTDEFETFTFQTLSHDSVDWSDKSHVLSINKWRYDIFRSHGIAVKRVNIFFHPDEEAWLMLFHKKIKLVVESGHMIKLPGPMPTMDSFNKFFVGKVLCDADGEDMLPREPRDETSIASKLQHANSSGFKNMRDVIRKLLEGTKGGLLYVPVITKEELLLYQTDDTVANDDPTEEGKNAAIVDGTGRRRSSPKRKRDATLVEGALEKRVKH